MAQTRFTWTIPEEKLARMNAGGVNRLVVALSGGVDSVVLLHSLVSASPGKPIVAIHINHGLQKEADSWQQFCEEFCRTLNIEIKCIAVEVDRFGSVEENARRVRYHAFGDFLKAGDLLLLAHHADDQLETILFNLFRGSEALGVRGMPEAREINGATLYRPLLDTRRSEIQAYSKLNNLSWVEDLSNQDLQMDRNYLRHEILPAITARFPAAEKALLNGLERDRNVSLLIDDIAKTDLESVVSEDGGLKLQALIKVSELRIVNLLRHYLRLRNVPFPSGNMLRECAAVMLQARKDASPVLKWATYEFRRHGETMYLLRDMRSVDTSIRSRWDPATKLQIGGGVLCASLVAGQGIMDGSPLPLEVRFRQGGEQIQQDRSRRVKKLFQENNVPEWLRARLPLIFQGDRLVAIPGIPAWNVPPVISKAQRAKTGENGWIITFDIEDRL